MRDKVIVSERGTVTIPEAIRKIARISAGDLLQFEPRDDELILRRLVIKKAEEDLILTDAEWDKLDRLVRKQIKHGEYSGYKDLEKAKKHSRRLMQSE